MSALALALPLPAAHAGGVPTSPTGESTAAITGPSIAPVDARFASPQAARQQLIRREIFRAGNAKRVQSLSRLDPAIYGQWNTLGYTTTVRAIHVTLLHTGKVLLAAGSGNNVATFVAGTFTAEIWDPVAATLTAVPPPWDMFCSGHVVEPDGNVLVMGGTISYPGTGGFKGSKKAYRFNVATQAWEALADMKTGRWYPTAVLDPAGDKVLVYSGKDEFGLTTRLNEVYDRLSNSWSFLPTRLFPMYPGLLWTKKDQLFFSGASTQTTMMSAGLLSPYTGTYRTISGGIDMTLRRGAATVFAGAVQDQLAWLVGGGFPATASTVLTDLNPQAPVSVPGPSLPTAKAYVSAVNLPDLTVLETGGGTARKTPVYEASIFQPDSRTLNSVAPPAVGRTYHSSAILLPDGSVATFGGDPGKNLGFKLQIEIYKPPYFFKGPRPVISSAPTDVNYGGAYPIVASATGATLAKAVLIRPASTTHSTDSSQRSIALDMQITGNGAVLTMPTALNIAPRGWYMLFVTDSLGRPSEAAWVHLS